MSSSGSGIKGWDTEPQGSLGSQIAGTQMGGLVELDFEESQT